MMLFQDLNFLVFIDPGFLHRHYSLIGLVNDLDFLVFI
jgi:hypothetical protein